MTCNGPAYVSRSLPRDPNKLCSVRDVLTTATKGLIYIDSQLLLSRMGEFIPGKVCWGSFPCSIMTRFELVVKIRKNVGVVVVCRDGTCVLVVGSIFGCFGTV